MTNLEETMLLSHEERYKLFWEKLFPSPLAAHAGDYIINLLGNGSMDEFGLDTNFRGYIALLSEACGHEEVAIEVTSKAVSDAIAILLDRQLIGTWEDRDEEGTVTTYYELPEDNDND